MQNAIELAVDGLTLRGMLHKPDNTAPSYPVVAIYHGFTGQKAERHFVFVRLSRALAAAGLASVRFDFSGSGESDGEFAGMTLSGEVAEAKAILDYARSLPFADRSRVFVVGFSMGGAVASVVAGEAPDRVRALVLWAPAGNMPELIAARHTPEIRAEMAKSGRFDLGGLWAGREFFADLAGWDIYRRAAPFPGRVLLIHGDADESVPLAASQRYQEIYGAHAELQVVPGADHTFNRADWKDDVIRRTVEFLSGESTATP